MLSVYWSANSAFTAAFTIFLKQPRVRQYFNIPNVPDEPQYQASPDQQVGFIDAARDSMRAADRKR
jgi:hypothetical protein